MKSPLISILKTTNDHGIAKQKQWTFVVSISSAAHHLKPVILLTSFLAFSFLSLHCSPEEDSPLMGEW